MREGSAGSAVQLRSSGKTGIGMNATPSSARLRASSRRRLAIDAALVGFAEMDLARFLGEFVADIVGVLAHLFRQRLELRHRLALLLAHGERDRLALAAGRDGWRHQALVDAVGAAGRAVDEAALALLVEIVVAAEPALEFVVLVAGEAEADQEAALSRGWPDTAVTAKSRAFFRLGIFLRAASDAAVSISA